MIEKIWYLPAPYTEDDCVWVDNSGLLYEVISPEKWDDNDSGWCDYATGQEILTNLHEVYLRTTDEKGEMWLKLKYIDRVKLHQLRNHNMSEVLRRKQNDTAID